MADKDFKTIDEQIEILRSRGLTIEDEAEAKDFLLRNNYYRVSGYSLTLRKNDVFAKSATFQNIEDAGTGANYLRHALHSRCRKQNTSSGCLGCLFPALCILRA